MQGQTGNFVLFASTGAEWNDLNPACHYMTSSVVSNFLKDFHGIFKLLCLSVVGYFGSFVSNKNFSICFIFIYFRLFYDCFIWSFNYYMNALDTFIQSDLEDMFHLYMCSFDIKPMTLLSLAPFATRNRKQFQQHWKTGSNKSRLFVSSISF